MRSAITISMVIFSLAALAMTCEVSAEYRCRGGRTGTLTGKGGSADDAKNHARDRAREICGGRVDYIRFADNTSTC